MHHPIYFPLGILYRTYTGAGDHDFAARPRPGYIDAFSAAHLKTDAASGEEDATLAQKFNGPFSACYTMAIRRRP